MSKEWILNAATGRFQLNFKRNVGAVAGDSQMPAKEIGGLAGVLFSECLSHKPFRRVRAQTLH